MQLTDPFDPNNAKSWGWKFNLSFI